MGDRLVVVAFDFDGTLTHHDSVVPFLRRVAGTGRLVTGLVRNARRLVPALVRRDRDALKALATKVTFTGRTYDEIVGHADEYGALVITDGLRADTAARLRWHLDKGHIVLIVSASYEPYVRVVGRHFGVHEVLATRLETASDGSVTGRLDGLNCRGPEKVARLDQWLALNETARSEITLWAYGDSAGDRDLLAIADHPVWVKGLLASVAPTL